jgi:predicted ATPase
MRGRQSISEVSCEISFDAKDVEAQREIAQIQPLLFSSLLSVTTSDPESGDHNYHLTVRRAELKGDEAKRKWIDATNTDEPTIRSSLRYDVEMDEESLAEIHEEFTSAQPVGCQLRHFLPERVALGVDMLAEDARAIVNFIGEGPRGYSRRISIARRIAVPGPIIDRMYEIGHDLGGYGETLRSILAKQLEQQQSLFGEQPIYLDQLSEALRRMHPRVRMEIRKKLTEDDSFETFVEESVHKMRGGHSEEPAVIMNRAPSPIFMATRHLDQFFSDSIKYLGPLRDEPKSLYPISPTVDPSDVGIKGEHTAAVLELHKNLQVRYLPTSAFIEPEIVLNPITRSLETAVTDWLRYLGVAENIEIRDKGKFGHELTVSINGTKRKNDLTHVGVGVSQVLPILVVSLLAKPNTTLVFEQPELHLHPKVQTLLADFFLSMTQLGKQCIVETHSEYFINRIRFRAAAAVNNNPWVQAVKIFFVEKGDQESSFFREVNVNEYGAILEWPEGFFDQSQRESEMILRAAAMKRKTKGGKQS